MALNILGPAFVTIASNDAQYRECPQMCAWHESAKYQCELLHFHSNS